MVTIAARLKALREDRGVSSRAFAAAVAGAGFPVSHAAVLGYETEREAGEPESVPGGYLAAVCRAFGVEPAWLLTDTGPRERPATAATDDYAAGLIEAVAELRKVADQLEARAGKQPAPEVETGSGETTGGGGGRLETRTHEAVEGSKPQRDERQAG